jgi:hypothetical protein
MKSKPMRRPYKRMPCKNCISLPFCISIFKQYNKEDLTHYKTLTKTDHKYRSYIFLRDLVNRCSLIVNYVFDDTPIEVKSKNIKQSKYKTTYHTHSSNLYQVPRSGVSQYNSNVSMYRIEKLKKFYYDRVYNR